MLLWLRDGGARRVLPSTPGMIGFTWRTTLAGALIAP